MFCKSCGSELDDDALFCMNCGVKVADDTSSKYCAHCGNELEADAVFCMGCGKRIHDEQKEPKLENSSEPANTKEEPVAESNLESAKEKEESEEATPQNAEPIIVAEPAKSETENETVPVPVISGMVKEETPKEKENSELVVSQKESVSEEKPKEELKEPKLENSSEPANTKEEPVAESNLESAKEKEESEETTPQNAEPVIVAEPAKSETENKNVPATVISEMVKEETPKEKENSELVVSQKESVSEENPNIEKDDANKNGKGIRVAIGIISGIFVLVLAILIGVGSKYKNPWIAPDVFNTDVLNAKLEIWTDNYGNKRAVNCYNISETDLEKLWNSIIWNSMDVSLIYAGSTWIPFEPEYDKIEDYNESLQSLMRKYDIMCIYYWDDDGSHGWIYLINRKTGLVAKF